MSATAPDDVPARGRAVAVVVAAAADLPAARVALRTFVDLHPGAGALLVVSDREPAGPDVAPVLGPLDLAVGPRARVALRAADAAPVAWALSAALDRGAEVAVLLGARQWVTGGLDDLLEAARRDGLALAGAVDASLEPEDAPEALGRPLLHPTPIAAAGTLAGRTALHWWKRALAVGTPPAEALSLLPGAAGAAVVHRPGLLVRAAGLPAGFTHSPAGYAVAGHTLAVADFAEADRDHPPADGVGADLYWEYGRRLFADGRAPGEGAPPLGA